MWGLKRNKKEINSKKSSFPGGLWQEAKSAHAWKISFLVAKINSYSVSIQTSYYTDLFPHIILYRPLIIQTSFRTCLKNTLYYTDLLLYIILYIVLYYTLHYIIHYIIQTSYTLYYTDLLLYRPLIIHYIIHYIILYITLYYTLYYTDLLLYRPLSAHAWKISFLVAKINSYSVSIQTSYYTDLFLSVASKVANPVLSGRLCLLLVAASAKYI